MYSTEVIKINNEYAVKLTIKKRSFTLRSWNSKEDAEWHKEQLDYALEDLLSKNKMIGE